MTRWMPRLIAVVLCALLATPLFAAGAGGGGGGGPDDPDKQTGPYKDAMDAIQAGPLCAGGADPRKLGGLGHSQRRRRYNWLGYVYRKTGKLDPAFKAYKRALGLDPQHKGAHEYIGEAYLMANQPDKAEAAREDPGPAVPGVLRGTHRPARGDRRLPRQRVEADGQGA